MSDYDTWEGERDRLLHAAGDDDRTRVAELLDAAAGSARQSRLSESARKLEELRSLVVGQGLFPAGPRHVSRAAGAPRLPGDSRRDPQRRHERPHDSDPDRVLVRVAGDTRRGEIRLVPSPAPKGCALLLLVAVPSGALVTAWLLT